MIVHTRTPRYQGSAGVVRDGLKQLGRSSITEIKVLDWRIQGEIIVGEVTDELDRDSELIIGPDWRVRRNK